MIKSLQPDVIESLQPNVIKSPQQKMKKKLQPALKCLGTKRCPYRNPAAWLMLWASALLLCYQPLHAQEAPPQGPPPAEQEQQNVEPPADAAAPLSQQVEDLKQTVLDLNRDLLILEEELLFPANTQVALFLSMDVGEFFHLDAVKVKIDDKLVASHLYTERQVDALYRGGVQRLFLGNLKSGSHEITAFFTGKGPEGREYKRGATITVDKQQEPKMLELRIVDSTAKMQPVFDIKEWQL